MKPAVMSVAAVLSLMLVDASMSQHIDTVAGDGTPQKVGQPFGVEMGPDGKLYICEVENHRVLRLDMDSGALTTFAGTGLPGYKGDGGPAASAQLNEPYEVRFDRGGNMFFVEMKNHIVRRVDAKTGRISTVAGTGESGFAGDGASAAKAQFNRPHSTALFEQGDRRELYIADIGNHRIRRVDLTQGTIQTIAGTGEKKLPIDGKPAIGKAMVGPRALFVHEGTLWVALREGHSVWRMSLTGEEAGILHHVAGTGKRGYSGDGGPAKDATFNGPKGIAVGPHSNIYIVDTENQAIRKIDATDHTIATIAGLGPKARGFAGDGGVATRAKLDRPHGVFVGPKGIVFVGDTNNHRVRKIWLSDTSAKLE